MNTCEICGQVHGSDLVHITRTVDGVTERYLDRAFVAAYSPCVKHVINSPVLKLKKDLTD